MKKTVIVGFGSMGSRYSDMIYRGQVKGLALQGILCRNQAGQEKIRQTMPEVSVYENEEELFGHREEFDAVIITTPHKEHVRVVKRAAAAGLSVLCEKPLGICAGECREAAEAAGAAMEGRKNQGQESPQSSCVFAMVFNWRAREIYRKVKDILDSGQLGRIHHVLWTANFWYRPEYYHRLSKWRSSWEGEGGGLLINQSQHLMDMWNWLFGQPDRVFARLGYGKFSNIPVDDEVTLLFSHANGMEGTFFSSTGDSPGSNRLEIHADMGKLVMEEEKRLVFYRNAASTALISKTAAEANPIIPFVKETTEIVQEKDEYQMVLQNFADALQGKARPLAELADGLRAIENANAAYLSEWRSRWQGIPCDEEEYQREKIAFAQKKSDELSGKSNENVDRFSDSVLSLLT